MRQDPVNSELRVVSREQLYELVWSTPVTRAAARLKVSDSYAARICTALDVPRPPRGWWTRTKAGQTPARPPLPPPRPGRPLSWSKDAWGGSLKTYYERRRVWQAPAGDIHPLAVLATEIFRVAKTEPTASLLVTRANNAIDVAASAETLRRALAFANALFLALEERGHSVTVAARRRFTRPRIEIWDEPPVHCSEKAAPDLAPRWPTVATLHGMPAGLAIVETCRETQMRYLGGGKFEPVPPRSRKGVRPVVGITWNEWRPQPSGQLKLVAYSPIHPPRWRREWRTSKLHENPREVELIIDELEEIAAAQSAATATP
ncbi:hypothetical protein HJC04_00135 [Rhizobium sp. NLR8a]|uniref:hypothetical protein n=1 Tax=Rhizobium sp. NLR8a TaxID=2731119 RepID=UPI001C82A711|nr:hypothetical protein [Rhizobium sp. NLR8a]MBX5218775.1 hypothetical protein [Rhizobium sp. NLR8a]